MELECGLHIFMEVLNGKYKINLIWCIYGGINRPSDLQRRMPKASRRLLDTQLKQLTDQGIIAKTVFDQRPPKVQYELTPLGKTLIPIIGTTALWGEEHRAELEPLLVAAGIK